MLSIEKTVFISYRRADAYAALAVYKDLTNHGYDVFFDYTSIPSGDFEQNIISNIKARAHFILILTPTALDRCSEKGDWLRREIETAIDEQRNIVPLFFKKFTFGTPSTSTTLTGKLKDLSKYNGMNVHDDFFDAAMERLRKKFLDIPLNTILHPVSSEVQKIVEQEQFQVNKVLDKGILEFTKLFGQSAKTNSLNIRRYFISVVILLIAGLCIFGAFSTIRNLGISNTSTATPTGQIHFTTPVEPLLTPSTVVPTSEASSTTPTPVSNGVVSPKDGMVLISVPAGEFQMGSIGNDSDERPVHLAYLDAYLIDQTEITNSKYAKCVEDEKCKLPRKNTSIRQNNSNNSYYYGNPIFDNYPVVYVSWNDAKSYCSWAGRRLPTEAEWEKAASWNDEQQTKRVYPWGKTIDCSYANFWGNGDKLCVGDTTPVGNYPKGASFYGVLDMAGNVFEWVVDRYDSEYYANLDYSNPTGPRSGANIVVRGGSFLIGRANAIRSSDREFQRPDYTSYSLGFRCAMDAE